MCRTQLKFSSHHNCFALDEVVRNSLSSKELNDYESRTSEFKAWKQKKEVDNVSVGTKLDVLDTEGVWCKGEVKLVVDYGDKAPMLLIHYLGWDSRYDELICKTSDRVAPEGFYTSKNIPRYCLDLPEGNLRARVVYNDN